MLATLLPLLADSDFGGILGCVFISVCGLVGLACFLFTIWMLIEAITKEPSEGNDKIIWIVVILFVGIIGAAIYYFVRRPERIRKFGR